ncbi:DUF1707 domain-containing protein [Microlunatus elymi]|uniref:DUF1707 domain-containing protein n=1 Tax=Microlunatus elymi TaxID=2596828 RepID=A0A516Q4W5_9ACTN|nr:DUF1707 domain-containing protein [Microlunatus elymi]
MRASDADRDQVATVLSTAYAEGRLTLEEHDDRLSQAMAAKTFAELIPITQDLVYTGSPQPKTAPEPESQIDTNGATTEPDRMMAVFGGTTRKGRWRVRKHIQAYALFGGQDLDMRDAIFESPVVEISGFWCFGGLDLKVPEGMEIRDQTMGIFGGTEIKHVGEPEPGAPVLVIKGVCLFGGVSVKGMARRPKATKAAQDHWRERTDEWQQRWAERAEERQQRWADRIEERKRRHSHRDW